MTRSAVGSVSDYHPTLLQHRRARAGGAFRALAHARACARTHRPQSRRGDLNAQPSNARSAAGLGVFFRGPRLLCALDLGAVSRKASAGGRGGSYSIYPSGGAGGESATSLTPASGDGCVAIVTVSGF